MSFFDNLGKKLNTFGGEVKDSTKDIADIQQYKRKIAQEKEKINQTYLELGSLYYDAHSQDENGEYQDIIEKIKEAHTHVQSFTDEIDRIQREAEQRKAEIKAEIKAESLAEKAKTQRQQEEKTKKICPSCNYANESESLFCEMCGSRLNVSQSTMSEKKEDNEEGAASDEVSRDEDISSNESEEVSED